ncbi:MAG: two-component regulator propeller domain-containing protein [Vicinamibacterales bacterium]
MRFAGLLACTLAVTLAAAPLRAADGPDLLTGYNLTSWTQKDGLSNPLIWSVEQDTVGYLWLGTDAGALRFDGVRFVPWEALARIPSPGASVRTIASARDGAVWFGLGEPGGVVMLKNGLVRTFTAADALPEGVVMSLAEDARGTIWAAGRFGVARLDGDTWHRVSNGLPAGTVNVLEADGRDLLAGTSAGIFRWRPDAGTWTREGSYTDNARSIARDARGRLWTADPIVGLRLVDSPDAAAPRLKGRGAWLMRDSRRNLWVGTGGQGLFRLQFGEGASTNVVVERTSTATGMSDDGVTDFEEDRDGNIWVATRDGLNRLTPHRMTPITDVGVVTAVAATPDGRIWVGSADDVVSFEDGRATGRSAALPIGDPPLAAMYGDPDGHLWVATARRLYTADADRLREVRLHGADITELTDITSDGHGGLWLHDRRLGVLRWRDGVLSAGPLPAAFQSLALLASYTDREGRAWFSFEQSRIAAIDRDGRVQSWGPGDGLHAGPYRAIHQDRAGLLWFGGDGGLTRHADGRFATVSPSADRPIKAITGILDDDADALWLAIEAAGLVRVSRDEITSAMRNPSHRLSFSSYDKVDGSAGTSRWFGHRAAVRSMDGHLWFVAGRGITVVDPASIGGESPEDQAVRIEGALADGRSIAVAPAQSIEPGTARVQIDYTVIDLTSPQKRRFRYRLDGFDSDWVEAGTRHSAFYTNLPPRAYTFRVMASRADGSFPGTHSEWTFTLRPAFYQTWWFTAVAVGLAILAVAGVWRMHIRRMRREFSMLVGERARLSREVHDTLLQSMFGYALQFDALAQVVPASDLQLRARLAQLRHQVEDDIREARQSIWNLRSPTLERQDLASGLRRAVELAAASRQVHLTMTVAGEPARETPRADEQLLRIGREAVSNALRHAHPDHVRVSLEYGVDQVVLIVHDDGCGFEPDTAGSTPGHFGLTTMRERAQSVGGTLTITSAPGAGTTIRTEIPLS